MLQLAQAYDRISVEALARQVHQQHINWRPDIYDMPDELYPAERFENAVAAKQLYVAKLENIVVGYARVKVSAYDWPGVVKRKVMFLDELAVHELYRNHGIGTAIMDDVKALARAFGCIDLQLGVYPQNDAAVAFYQKNGLTIRSIDMQMKL